MGSISMDKGVHVCHAPTSSMSLEKGTEDVMDTENPLHPQLLEHKYSLILKEAHCEWVRTKATGNI